MEYCDSPTSADFVFVGGTANVLKEDNNVSETKAVMFLHLGDMCIYIYIYIYIYTYLIVNLQTYSVTE